MKKKLNKTLGDITELFVFNLVVKYFPTLKSTSNSGARFSNNDFASTEEGVAVEVKSTVGKSFSLNLDKLQTYVTRTEASGKKLLVAVVLDSNQPSIENTYFIIPAKHFSFFFNPS